MDVNTRAFKAGYHFGETAELFESAYQVRPAPLEPGTYTDVTGNTALAWGLIAAAQIAGTPALPGFVSRSRPPRTSSTSSRSTSTSVSGPSRRKTRSPEGRRSDRSRFRRKPRGHHHERPRHRPEVRGDRARGEPRGASGGSRHPARRPVDWTSDQDRAVGPTPRDVRATRGGPRSDRGGTDAVALLRGGYRGRAHSGQVQDPGIPALRRFARERAEPWKLPEICVASGDRPGLRQSPNHEAEDGTVCPGPMPATRRPSPGRGPFLVRRVSSTASVDSRRRTGQETCPYDPVEPRADDQACEPRRWPGSQETSRRSGSTIHGRARGGGASLALGWGSTYGSIEAAVRRVRARGLKRGTRPPGPPEPVPFGSGRGPSGYDRLLVPEANLGSARTTVRADFLVDARSLHEGAGRRLPGG